MGVGVHGTVILKWTGKIFESETNVPHVVHRWKYNFFRYQFVMWHWPEIMMWEWDIHPRYNKATESWRENYMDNVSIEISLLTHASLPTKVTDHQTVVLFTK